MDHFITRVDQRDIHITNPDKVMWPEAGVTKWEYIQYLILISPYLLPYTENRLLTTIRYPDGIHGKSFYQKNIPSYAPQWLPTYTWRDNRYILLNDRASLVWVANQASLELHVSFHLYRNEDIPTEIVFDLDPMDLDDFTHVCEVALYLKEILDSLGLQSVAKTSGASGLQVYVPIAPGYTFEQTRRISSFIARYLSEKHPQLITLERMVKKRGKKLYFDYLQHWKGKTLPAPYSVRARPQASVSAPVTWKEVETGFHPSEFTMERMIQRVREKGDLFKMITTEKQNQPIEQILAFIDQHLSPV